MNTRDLIDFLYDHLNFLKKYGEPIYARIGISEKKLFSLLTYPFPDNLPKRKRNLLFVLKEEILREKNQLSLIDPSLCETFYREKIIYQHQKALRYLPLNFKRHRRKRKQWIMS